MLTQVLIAALLLTLVGVYFFLLFKIYNRVFVVKERREYWDDTYLGARLIKDDYIQTLQWAKRTQHKEISITSHDGLKLYGRYFDHSINSPNIILIHGYRSVSNRMLDLAKFYFEDLNMNVLLIDLRGHGLSDGNSVGMGYLDSIDLISWVNYLNGKSGRDIAIHGLSMGAVTALNATNKNMDNVKVIIADSGFSSFKDMMNFYFKKNYKLPAFLFYGALNMLTILLLKTNLDEINPIKKIESSLYPVLFIHGGADHRVPVSFSKNMFNVCASKKDMLIIEGADHTFAYVCEFDLYRRKIVQNLANYIKY
jgi:fermentation-respiration switch protein FrsA (DUF1100 family)